MWLANMSPQVAKKTELCGLLKTTSSACLLHDDVVEEEVFDLVTQVVGVDGVASRSGCGAVLFVDGDRRGLGQHIVHVSQGVGGSQRALDSSVDTALTFGPERRGLASGGVLQGGGLMRLLLLLMMMVLVAVRQAWQAAGWGSACAAGGHLVRVHGGEVDDLPAHPIDVVAGAVLQRRDVGGKAEGRRLLRPHCRRRLLLLSSWRRRLVPDSLLQKLLLLLQLSRRGLLLAHCSQA